MHANRLWSEQQSMTSEYHYKQSLDKYQFVIDSQWFKQEAQETEEVKKDIILNFY